MLSSTQWLPLTALVFGAFCACVLITIDAGSWTPNLIANVPWALLPYTLLLAVLITINRLPGHPSAPPLVRWGIVAIALAGPLLYLDSLFLRLDAHSGLVMLTVPIIQLVALLLLIGTALAMQWLVSSTATGYALPRTGASASRKLLTLFAASAALAFVVLYIVISVIQYSDRKVIAVANEVNFYITQYCKAQQRLPSSAQLLERFPALTTEHKWFYFTDDRQGLTLQYPVRWKNSSAPGKPLFAEFTATVFAYSMDYRCAGVH